MKESLKIFKIGGGIIDNPMELNLFLYELSLIEGKKILIHGGGRIVNEHLKKLGLEPQMVGGRRITDDATLEIVVQFYAGVINKKIVAELQKYNENAIGLSGADGNAIQAIKRPIKEFDYGWVGDLLDNAINTSFISLLIENNLTPVFSAITHDKKGQLLNTNADTIAANIAMALSSSYEIELHYCFDKKGVLRDINDENSVILEINHKVYQTLKQEKIIFEGMIPKLDNAFEVLSKGVKQVILEHPSNINTSIKTVLIN